MDLLKLVDSHIKGCFLGKQIHWSNLFFLELYLEVPEGIEQHDIKLT